MVWYFGHNFDLIAFIFKLNESFILSKALIIETVIHFDNLNFVLSEVVLNLFYLQNIIFFPVHFFTIEQILFGMVWYFLIISNNFPCDDTVHFVASFVWQVVDEQSSTSSNLIDFSNLKQVHFTHWIL